MYGKSTMSRAFPVETVGCPYLYVTLLEGTTKWGPRSIAKLVNITPIAMVYDTYIILYTVFMGFINQQTSPGGHIRIFMIRSSPHCCNDASGTAAREPGNLSAVGRSRNL